ncbi:hypothetical protein C2845_PM17G09060 [Panicum miliaceum]|uniref:Uncharacterized protein n=1 Tax=Panicum miliaceum TaxID=4540 RepID=A0A3L6Q1J1_PANMI|nr:hypothetical protein C2845_PM17G09060 [Panicum miliaceum]
MGNKKPASKGKKEESTTGDWEKRNGSVETFLPPIFPARRCRSKCPLGAFC